MTTFSKPSRAWSNSTSLVSRHRTFLPISLAIVWARRGCSTGAGQKGRRSCERAGPGRATALTPLAGGQDRSLLRAKSLALLRFAGPPRAAWSTARSRTCETSRATVPQWRTGSPGANDIRQTLECPRPGALVLRGARACARRADAYFLTAAFSPLASGRFHCSRNRAKLKRGWPAAPDPAASAS